MSGGFFPVLCAACVLPAWACRCPYFHRPEPLHTPFVLPSSIDHSRPNPFQPTAEDQP